MNQDKVKLAMYIRDGLDFAKKNKIKEIRMVYFKRVGGKVVNACVLGMAMLGKIKDIDKTLDMFYDASEEWASVQASIILEVDFKIVNSVLYRYVSGNSIQSILEWLDEEENDATTD